MSAAIYKNVMSRDADVLFESRQRTAHAARGLGVCKLKFAAANAMIANYFDHGHAKYRSKRERERHE